MLDTELDGISDFVVSPEAAFIAGNSKSTSPYEWMVEKRSRADGKLVPGFGNAGALKIPLAQQGPGNGAPRILVDGADLYVGYMTEPSFVFAPKAKLEKRSADTGALVWSQTVACFEGLANDDTSIFVGCFGYFERRAKTDGVRVPGFGDGGLMHEPTNINNCRVFGFLRDGDSLVTYGQAGTVDNLSNNPWVDTLDRTSGARLWAHKRPGYGYRTAGASDGTAAYFAGLNNPHPWVLEKRALPDGGPVSGFATDGELTGDPLLYPRTTRSLVLRGGIVYLAGTRSPNGKDEWWVHAVDAATGAPVQGFGTMGTLLLHSGPMNGGNRVILHAGDDASLYLLGSIHRETEAGIELEGYRLERRDRLTGAL